MTKLATFCDRVTVNLRDALNLMRNKDLEELERAICCKFSINAQAWNEYAVTLQGTEIGVRKGRAMVLARVSARRPPRISLDPELLPQQPYSLLPRHCTQRAATAPPTYSSPVHDLAECFARLPGELKQMIIHHVLWGSGPNSGDGRRLVELRRVSKSFKEMVEREMIVNGHRCAKRVLYLAEGPCDTVQLGFQPLDTYVRVTFEQLDHLLALVDCSASAKTIGQHGKYAEVYIRCDFRRTWCHQILALLLKHENIQPEVLKARGILCDGKMFARFVESRPSLNHLFFEKPLCDANFFRHRFFPYRTYAFDNLGPQDRSPENVRNNFNIYHGYHRNSDDVPALREMNDAGDRNVLAV